MATQSLYRRYRPRRFSEVKGQEHVVRALRNAVINHREGQAYLFSGPRGTGKTTSARILAKVLNCERPVDGEPCCECDSCLAVERGTSYDVHELDAASNNGVDAMRDLIEKASLGTPGRHKVYILDEVHMLSKAAEAALLKTLEEPPPHVVFVLATTDPQKVSDTIRSRTQHLQFHLLPMDVLEEHIRWLAADAGIERRPTPRCRPCCARAAVRRATPCRRSSWSPPAVAMRRETTPLDEFIEAFIEHDPGRALAVVAHAVQQGRDPRTLDRRHHPPPARLLPVADGTRARAAARRSARPRCRRWPRGSARRRSCGRWSGSARCSSRCATHPTRGCCSRSRWCS